MINNLRFPPQNLFCKQNKVKFCFTSCTMDWMCLMVDTQRNNTTVSVEYEIQMNHSDMDTWMDGNYTIETEAPSAKQELMKHEMIMTKILIPGVCAFGLLGNLLALVVLLSRMCEGIELLEKGSLFSMIGKTDNFKPFNRSCFGFKDT